ncbi:probable glycoprotein hormone G-protein coupled receptor [Stylophora pistillata]|uniref:probable glycoprotein hormone G-protein coupled receptor n=1 Tax=Stylophora pistillata TaxID=50429 RepID=UPI000C05305B|nr:probable glycoprotein hormone G-protein coupled receptor [Stylophora pistillata]XP_022810000.1 probable glycoprotein hormone G-protein coupled receptor [Stylophora pistillata]
MVKQILTLLLVAVFLSPRLSASVTEMCVTPICRCTSHPSYNVTVICHTNDVKYDLSHSIKKSGEIVALSVIDENATNIPEGTFAKFTKLKYLELKFKNLKTWNGNISQELPSLEAISLVTMSVFAPPIHVLKAPKLQRISGATWSNACTNRTLVKNQTHINVTRFQKGLYDIYPKSFCRGSRYVVESISRLFAKYGFIIIFDEKCFASEVTVIPMHRCWDSANEALYVEYLLTPLIIILNLTVFFTMATTKTLRKLPCMLLVANLAMSDFFLGVYSLVITSSRHALTYQPFVGVMSSLCPALGFVWVVGQFGVALSSLLLTTERYIAIIFSMRPSISVTTKLCLYCMGTSWTIAVFMASLPFFGVGTYTTTTFCLPIQPAKGIPHSFAYSISVVANGFLLYIITIPMYLHIFVHVRKSGNRMGVKRDGKLAKKISILVVSNFIFFLVPVFIGVLWLMTQTFNNVSLTTREILVGSLTTVCFSINSFLNPLLYAFRDRRFRVTLKHRLHRLIHPNTTFVQQVSYRSAADTRSYAGNNMKLQ